MAEKGDLSGDFLLASSSLHLDAVQTESPLVAMMNLANSTSLARSAMMLASGAAQELRSIDLLTGRLPHDKTPLEALHERIGKPTPHGNIRVFRADTFYTPQDIERAAEYALGLIDMVARMNPELAARLQVKLNQSARLDNTQQEPQFAQMGR